MMTTTTTTTRMRMRMRMRMMMMMMMMMTTIMMATMALRMCACGYVAVVVPPPMRITSAISDHENEGTSRSSRAHARNPTTGADSFCAGADLFQKSMQ
eukprot:6771032-Pyramimonas_sp.AAC.1